jgi:hypothetical protein
VLRRNHLIVTAALMAVSRNAVVACELRNDPNPQHGGAALPRSRPSRGTVGRGLDLRLDRTIKAAFGPGITFAGYRVEAIAGRGGMGVSLSG